jgi:uncharacterized protein (UPF0248 family)
VYFTMFASSVLLQRRHAVAGIILRYPRARSRLGKHSLLSGDAITFQTRLFAELSDDGLAAQQRPEAMANLYTEWSLDDDQFLFENRSRTLPELASLLGRGLRGVESRISKLTDVNSPAYARLFAGSTYREQNDNEDKLIPAKEVLRRIQWDYSLDPADFSVLHYDRVEDSLMESQMDAPNTSVKGGERLLVMAIPEHRIAAIKYKERIIWDKASRIDRVFGSMGGQGETIQKVMDTYDEWKRQMEATEEWNRKRQAQVSADIQEMLGVERFGTLKQLSSSLIERCKQDGAISSKREIENYVQKCLQLFRDATQSPDYSDDPGALAIQSDAEWLDLFSELVALLPESNIRPAILTEISIQMSLLDGRNQISAVELPELDEDDLVETFVRGSGAGGQKINKTSNRVVLLHMPTQLRVEVQDTRSLQQNRKIARKRLRLKLDEYLNGRQSKLSQKNEKAAKKKAKAKARNKSRLKKKKEAKATGFSDDD